MDLFGAISDEMRLKILLLLDQAEFTVNEIKDILDIHQSNASRHLAKLSACNLLKDRRDGIKAYYRLSEELYLSTRMLSMIRDAFEALPDKDILKCRAAQVLEDRTDKTKGQIHKLDQAGGSLKAQISLFGRLMYPFENAVDVGCGEGGDLTLMLCHRCKHVTALDYDPQVVSGLQKILKQKNILNVTPKVADMVNTGLPDNFADLVLMSRCFTMQRIRAWPLRNRCESSSAGELLHSLTWRSTKKNPSAPRTVTFGSALNAANSSFS